MAVIFTLLLYTYIQCRSTSLKIFTCVKGDEIISFLLVSDKQRKNKNAGRL